MLKSTYQTNDVLSVKLTSGEEIIGRYVSNESGELTLRKPVSIVPHGEGMGFAPYMFTTEQEEFALNHRAVTCVAKTAGELAKQYLERTSGIIM
jgi:hypothetical protein